MDTIAKETLARHRIHLEAIKNLLKDSGFNSSILDATTIRPLHILIANLGENRTVTFMMIPTNDADLEAGLLQVYSELEAPINDATSKADLCQLLIAINRQTPTGNFGISEEDGLFFRYVFLFDEYGTLHEATTLEMIDYFLLSLEMYGPVIIALAEGNIGLEEALRQVAAPGPE